MNTVLIERTPLAETATERLEAEATTLAGHLAAGTCRFLEVVAELARREAWRSWDARSMAHWVAWKCGFGLRAAQEHVRVALALVEVPLIHAAFAREELSFAKVRALTRFADGAGEAKVIDFAHHATASQLETVARIYVAGLRAASKDQAEAALAASPVSTHTNADGTVTITARVPADIGARATAALDHAAGELPRDECTTGNARRVLAFAAVIDGYLDPDPDCPQAVEIVGHVDLETLTEDAPGQCILAGYPIATESMRRLACDCAVRLSLDRDEQTLDLGRRARLPNPALRRAIERRDEHRCRFPGCTQRSRLRVHHAQHWSHLGPTDRDNLLLLCPTHHRTVHEGGWNVKAGGSGRFTFRNPQNRPVPDCVVPPPAQAESVVGANDELGLEIEPDSIRSLSEGERMDLDLAMTGLCSIFPYERHQQFPDAAGKDHTAGPRTAERSERLPTDP